MSEVGSYEVSTFSTGVQAEVKRLNAQIDLFWDKEIDLYRRWGLSDNLHIADLGCGPGYLIERLLQQFPSSKFVGVEQSTLLADLAQERLKKYSAVENVFKGSIDQFTPPEHSFDFVLIRLVLEHVPNPIALLQHIRTFLKPVGKIIVIDNDFDFHLRTFPDIKEFEQLYKAYCASRTQDHGDPCIGRKLPMLLKAAGFSEIDLEILLSHSQITGDTAFLNAEGAGIPAQLIKSGHLSEQVLDSLVAKWRTMLRSPDHCMFRQLFAATGTASKNDFTEQVQLSKNTPAEKITFSFQCSSNFLEYVKNLLAQTLGLKTDELDLDLSLINAGLDSIGASDIGLAIQQVYKIEISMSELLGGLNSREIAQLIENRMGKSQSTNSSNTIAQSEDEIGTV
jgi:ubiquinone/menaquinone biosynthesis C-methylase UbiE/acyl carrier protein